MLLELVLLDGSERRFTIEEGAELMVGVAAHCPVRLSALDVSRTHALISCQRGKCLLLDLRSTNGTFVNGKRVREAELAAGDTVRFSSVMAQLVATRKAGEAEDDETSSGTPPDGQDGAGSSASAPGVTGTVTRPTKPPTDDRAPAPVHDSLNWLLERWQHGEQAALAVFVEWLVAEVGMLGAAVLETVGPEVVVAAADGDVEPVLDDPGCAALVRGRAQAASSVESIEVVLGGRRVAALQGPAVPWLLLIPGKLTPASSELDLIMHLLAVARRIDVGEA